MYIVSMGYTHRYDVNVLSGLFLNNPAIFIYSMQLVLDLDEDLVSSGFKMIIPFVF